MMRRTAAVLLDRDGTINVKAASEDEYITRPEDVVLLPGAAAAISILNAAGIFVAVITNQRGIARGRMAQDDLEAVHAQLDALLAAQGARVDAYYVCPHDRDACDCRKPAPGLVLLATEDLEVPPAEVVVIGDRQSDVEAGRAAGARTLGIGHLFRETGQDWAPDLLTAVQNLLEPSQEW